MPKETILVVEDEDLMMSILQRLLTAEGYEVISAQNCTEALSAFKRSKVSLTITDIKLPDGSGLDLLESIKADDPSSVVIIITAFSSVDSAIVALRNGAFDFITKPFVNEDLLQSVKNGLDQRNLKIENRRLKSLLSETNRSREMIGSSESLQAVRKLIERVAQTSANVIILGESGTGKELAARSLHENGQNPEEPFLAVNCGALPEALLENELFGHSKGAFTGANSDHQGLFLAARKGTILLDEIGEMPLSLQVKLLRVLQEKEVTPLGTTTPRPMLARIIASTNKDLAKLINLGLFREDLYYRLNVVEINLPPLRERKDDIPLFVNHFVKKIADRESLPRPKIDNTFVEILSHYHWPGNIRELENTIERAVLLGGSTLSPKHISRSIVISCDGDGDGDGDSETSLDAVEEAHIKKVLAVAENDKTKAANLLGIDLSTLYRKLKRFSEN